MRFSILALVVLGAAACSSKKPPAPLKCTRDPALLAEKRACVGDEHCPCGTSCVLGQCAAACSTDADCGGGRCDELGQCRDPRDPARTPSPPPTGTARITVSEAKVTLVRSDAVRTIEIQAPDRAVGPTRVLAPPGYQVQCTPSGAFATECNVPGVNVGVPQRISVRQDMSAASRAADTITIFHGTERDTVGVEALVAAADPPLEGVYGGSAHLEGFGAISLPISAEVYPNGTVVITDGLKALHPSGKLIGTLTLDADGASGHLHLPAFRLLRGSALSGSDIELIVAADDAAAVYTKSSGTLALSLDLNYDGTGVRHHANWKLALTRSDALPAGRTAPAVPADEVASITVDPSRSTAWESAFGAVLDPGAATVNDPAELDGFFDRGSAGWVDLCVPGSTALVVKRDTIRRWSGPIVLQRLTDAVARAAAGFSQSGMAVTYLSGPETERLPCQVAFTTVNMDGLGVDLGTLDLCDAIAAQAHCRIADATPTAPIALRLDATINAHANSVVTQGTVQRECLLDPASSASGCTQMALCYEPPLPGQPGDRSALKATLVGQDVSAGEDLGCLAPSGRAVDLEPARRDSGAIDVLVSCVADLKRAREGVVPQPVARDGDGLRALFTSAGCLDAARYAFALGTATEPIRQGVHQRRAEALAHRLFTLWLTTIGFVARETQQFERMRAVIENVDAPSGPDAVDVSLGGWNLLLLPRFAEAMESFDPAVLAAPDYRASFLGAPPPDGEPAVGLPVVILETLETQADYLDALLALGHRRGDLSILDSIGRYLRLLPFLRDLSQNLKARAQAGGATPAWLGRYGTASQSLDVAVERLLERARLVDRGRNPLGIEPTDLPLYFFGDEMSAASRFTAISDFLLGSAGNPFAWAPAAVAAAQMNLDGARDAGLMMRNRKFEQAVDQADIADVLDGIRREFGGDVVSYCGLPTGLDPLQVLDGWPNFSASSCYVKSDDPKCRLDESEFTALLKLDDVKYQLCVVDELRRQTAGGIGFLNPAYDALGDEIAHCQTGLIYPAQCPDGVTGPCVQCAWTDRFKAILATTIPECYKEIPGGCTSIPVSGKIFSAVKSTADIPAQLLHAATTTCQGRFGGARTQLTSTDGLPGQPLTNPECYRGSLGESVLTLRAAAQDVEIARSQMADLRDAYDVAMRSCTIQAKGNTLLDSVEAEHLKTMKSLRDQKATADDAAALAGAVKDCASTEAGTDAPWNAPVALTACAAGFVEAGANIASIEFQRQMDEAQASHDALMMKLQHEIDIQVCFNDAEQNLVGIRTASLQIVRAMQDLTSALYSFQQDKVAAQRAYSSGIEAMAIARSRHVRPAEHDFWLSEAVDRYDAKMRVARRIVFLAVRAVEYEFQESLDAEQKVLVAELPSQLEMVLDDLRAITGTRSIRGNRPADLKVVLSLRKNLLQLSDLSAQPAGWQQLSDVDRFHALLKDARYASYGTDGHYVGQRVPFTLAPLGTFHLGETQGISIFAASDCAERLWTVNASILGDPTQTLYRGDAPTFTRIDLLKRNTFYSQWCDPMKVTADQALQLASVRPSRNLFRDPGVMDSPTTLLGAGSEETLESRARIQAYFNVDRATFESDDHNAGSTSELAARGLYGEYALFIPAEIISADANTNGLVLDAVDDILIRLDYVSVAR
ncbi:MAG: hypothetical protein U1E65_22460 [Myxococcota bacterium]